MVVIRLLEAGTMEKERGRRVHAEEPKDATRDNHTIAFPTNDTS